MLASIYTRKIACGFQNMSQHHNIILRLSYGCLSLYPYLGFVVNAFGVNMNLLQGQIC